VLSSEEHGPCNAARVLALEEQRLGFAILEPEDLAIATDVELALYTKPSASYSAIPCPRSPIRHPLIAPPSIDIATGVAEVGVRTFPG
jgi:hypothetical protein